MPRVVPGSLAVVALLALARPVVAQGERTSPFEAAGPPSEATPEPPPTPSEVSRRELLPDAGEPPTYLPTLLVGVGLVGAPSADPDGDDAWGLGFQTLATLPLFFRPRRARGSMPGWIAPAVGAGVAWSRVDVNPGETVENLLVGPFVGATYRARLPRHLLRRDPPLGFTVDAGWQPALVRTAAACRRSMPCLRVDAWTPIGFRLAVGGSFSRFATGLDYSYALVRGAGRFGGPVPFHAVTYFVGMHY
ncbi:MAG: hypothetical protein AAGH15_24000 [Myxococcota bacterium]